MSFYATKIIRTDFGTSYGIDTTPHETIESAVKHAWQLSDGTEEFRNDWIVMESRNGERAVPIPDEVLSFLKGVYLRWKSRST